MDSLLLEIQQFLITDLSSIHLPPQIDIKRRKFSEQIAALNLVPVPPIPEKCTSTPRRRSFRSVARFFTTKRYSLPASFANSSSTTYLATTNLSENVPSLPPKSTHVRNHTILDCMYEEPKNINVSTLNGTFVSPSSACSNFEPAVQPSFYKNRRPFSRLSLSPQLEIIQANRVPPTSDIIPSLVPVYPFTTSIQPAAADQARQNACSSNLSLPKKGQGSQARRFSAFMDQNWTLAGSLSHRHKTNKWTMYSICLLTSSFRLLGYKSSHSASPSLALFLCGATGIFSGRDSGMDYVVKIAYPGREPVVLAACSEDQALMWVKQINQYAQGITPTEVISFLPQSATTAFGTNRLSGSHLSNNFNGSTVSSTKVVDSLVQNGLTPSESQTDKQFLLRTLSTEPVGNHVSSTQPPTNKTTTGQKKRYSIACDRLDVDSLFTAAEVKLRSSTQPDKKAERPTSVALSYNLDLGLVRCKPKQSLSLFSSLRRKFELIQTKRRDRKSMPQVNEVATSPSWSKDVVAAMPNDRQLGFGWAQLQTAGVRFLVNQQQHQHHYNEKRFSDGPTSNVRTSVAYHSQLLDLNQSVGNLSVGSQCYRSPNVIVAGSAYISIPNCVPWTKRWCRLCPNYLEIYPTDADCATDSPLFSLQLEPGHVELGLAGDRRRKSAIRLAVPTQNSTALLFDDPDNVRMAKWIRGFIQAALGIRSPEGQVDDQVKQWSAELQNNSNATRSLESHKIDFTSFSQVEHSSHFVANSQTYDTIHETNSLKSNDVIYDDVCPSSQSAAVSIPNDSAPSNRVRRWSTPLFVADSPRRLSFDANLAGSDLLTKTGAGWFIPPPSRRLLAQPLPTLPSLGPSACESMSGTITSSYASSNFTTDGFHDEFVTAAVGEKQMLNNAVILNSNSDAPICGRSSSLTHIAAQSHLSFDATEAFYYSPVKDSSAVDQCTMDILRSNSSPSSDPTTGLHQLTPSQCNVDDDHNHSFSTTILVDSANQVNDIPMVIYSDPMDYFPSPTAAEAVINDVNTNDLPTKSSKVTVARRCASCLTSAAKLPIIVPTCLSLSSTLPAPRLFVHRNGSTNVAWNLGSLSSTSSQTATSSGVALTGDSFSSPPTDGSKETTRPNSLAIDRRVEEEEIVCCDESDSSMFLHGIETFDYFCSKCRNRDSAINESTELKPDLSSVLEMHDVDHDDCDVLAGSTGFLVKQLEEIQYETKSLRSRKRNLSFRLSKLVNQQSSQVAANHHIEHSTPHSHAPSTVNSDSIVNRQSDCSNSDLNHQNNSFGDGSSSVYEQQRQHNSEDDALASLYARLSAIELLLCNTQLAETCLKNKLDQSRSFDKNTNSDLTNSTSTNQLNDTNSSNCAKVDNSSSKPRRTPRHYRRRRGRPNCQPRTDDEPPNTEPDTNPVGTLSNRVPFRGTGGRRGGRGRARFRGHVAGDSVSERSHRHANHEVYCS